jgi:hypothetical protein
MIVLHAHAIIFFDMAAILAMLVVASLSKTIGEALKIPAYYKLFYVTSILLAVAAFTDSVPSNAIVTIPTVVPMGLRCLAGLIIFPVGQRYWKFLISEYFKN